MRNSTHTPPAVVSVVESGQSLGCLVCGDVVPLGQAKRHAGLCSPGHRPAVDYVPTGRAAWCLGCGALILVDSVQAHARMCDGLGV